VNLARLQNRLDSYSIGGRNTLTGNDPKNVSNVPKTQPKSTKQDQEGRADTLCWHDNLCWNQVNNVLPQISCNYWQAATQTKKSLDWNWCITLDCARARPKPRSGSGNKLYCAYISPSKQEFCYNRAIIKYCDCMATMMTMLENPQLLSPGPSGPSCQNEETSHRTLHFAVTILFVTRYAYHPLSPALPAINTVINLLPYTEREGCWM